MNRSRFITLSVLAFILLLFAYVQKQKQKSEYLSQKEALLVFEKEAKELGGLKSKQRDKKIKQRAIDTLKRIKAPTKDYKKSNAIVLEFDGVDKRVLNQLIKKIQNSTLEIVNLDIMRDSDQLAKVRLEIKK